MELRTYKGLIRFILFLISIQIFSLTINPGTEDAFSKNYQSFRAEHSKTLSLSVFFEESKAEKETEGSEEDRLLHCFEIADLSFVGELLTDSHTPHISIVPIEQQFDLKPPLFKLHHIYLI